MASEMTSSELKKQFFMFVCEAIFRAGKGRNGLTAARRSLLKAYECLEKWESLRNMDDEPAEGVVDGADIPPFA